MTTKKKDESPLDTFITFLEEYYTKDYDMGENPIHISLGDLKGYIQTEIIDTIDTTMSPSMDEYPLDAFITFLEDYYTKNYDMGENPIHISLGDLKGYIQTDIIDTISTSSEGELVPPGVLEKKHANVVEI